MPAAAAEKGRQRPSGDRPCMRVNSVNSRGVAMIVAPPASAIAHSPRRSDWTARCSATSEDEQAVSTVIAGPCRPSV